LGGKVSWVSLFVGGKMVETYYRYYSIADEFVINNSESRGSGILALSVSRSGGGSSLGQVWGKYGLLTALLELSYRQQTESIIANGRWRERITKKNTGGNKWREIANLTVESRALCFYEHFDIHIYVVSVILGFSCGQCAYYEKYYYDEPL
jgi:hypothetical protein